MGTAVLGAVLAGAAAPAAGQTTGTAAFLSPYKPFASHEFAAYFSDPGAGFTAEGMYRFAGSGDR